MKITPLKIPDVKLIEPDVFEDRRGWFFESFNQKIFNELIRENTEFVQDNHSQSTKGVLRGLHYQEAPFEQGKLIRVIYGEAFDVAVDIRKDSQSYGQWVAEILSSDNKKQLWIPEGFAHGFLALSDKVELLYKTTNFYSKQHEKSIKWNDSNLMIEWPSLDTEYLLSEKDNDAEQLPQI